MGGEVIIITSDPDATAPAQPEPAVRIVTTQLVYGDHATPGDVASAVQQVLSLARDLTGS